jgi:hypothetical protein
MQLTARDKRIIQLVYRHRFLRSSHLVALIGESSQTIVRRLQLLYHHSYLERPRAQIDYYHEDGSRRIVYGIGKNGAKLLRDELGISFREARWGEKNRTVGRIFLEHTLLVSDVMVAVELACRATGRVRLITEDALPLPAEIRRLGQPFRWRVNMNKSLKLGIVPDRVFALEYRDLDDVSNRAFFFLEADRGTMPVRRKNLSQTSFYRKLLAYEATWSQAIHKKRFGFHRFRVLTITKSAERLKSLTEVCSHLKHGHGLFLFADLKSLDNPSDIFSPMWKTGRQSDRPTLLT